MDKTLIRKNITKVYKSLVSFCNIFLPPRCYHCNKNLNECEQILCFKCFSNLVYADMDEETLKKRYGLINLVSHFVVCFKYRQELPIQTLIHKFKYQGNRKAGQLLMDLYLKHIDIYQKFKDIDIIIPMPSHHRKKAKRGFNQCEIMARCIGEVLGKPVMTKAIVKEKNTPSQTTPGINRIENVKGVFAVCDANIIKDRYVLVIDDVITTSSTLKNCVKTVYKANPSKISVMVLAQVA